MSVEYRKDRLINLPNTNPAQITYEDKGSQFVVRNLDQLTVEQLTEFRDVRYSPGSVPRVNYRAQFMNKILYFHKKLNVFYLA